MSMATEFLKANDTALAILKSAEKCGLETDQDWNNETTYVLFSDGSKIAVTNNEYKVIAD